MVKWNQRMFAWIRPIIRNPLVDLVIGLVLVIFGLLEVAETLPQDIADLRFGSHHAVVVLGIVTFLRSLADIFAGVDLLDQSAQVRRGTKKRK